MENGRMQQMQQEVEDVRIIMLDNLKKADQRDCGLMDLENRSSQLEEKSKVFTKTTGQVRQKMSKKNLKWRVIVGVGIVAVIIIIIAIVVSISMSRSG